MVRTGTRRAAVGLLVTAAVMLLSVPVMAEVARLRSIPLGRGTATITWTGQSGLTPTITSVHGAARGLPIVATGTVPKPPHLGASAGATSVSIPASIPLADIEGSISGTAFTLHVSLTLSGLNLTSNKSQTFGTVTGSFRGQSIKAVLTGRPAASAVSFRGTIGSDHVVGTITRVVHHAKTSTAYATFNVTR